MGPDWATAKNNLATATVGGFFGYSAVGYGFAGGGPVFLPAPSLWGVSIPMPGGLTSGFELTVPEPSTFALAGLGGLSLLVLRRYRRLHRMVPARCDKSIQRFL
jgi:hypothetical protein